MLGMMNVGSDAQVEFYASARQSSLYARKPSKDSRTYTNEGRVLINGVPEVQDSPDELWRSLICKAVSGEVMRGVTRENGGPLAIIRRISSRLLLGQKPKVAVARVESEKDDDNKKNVTVVRIKTMHRKLPKKVIKRVRNDDDDEDNDNDYDDDNDAAANGHDNDDDDDDEEEVRIYAEEGILKCLMEKKAIFEREMGEISMEWTTDHDPETIDDENDIVVERF
ncbi:unnamed protein product [Angiostrongylus costaricensis]|uniref:S1-like domain-containing protein n=1 Tax=Angiostrongylus costaricensis TaxID=334426 RepID=A0A158PEN1_ANGCS|nr:unnamed protein product [Angiostrongylus costaricensis]